MLASLLKLLCVLSPPASQIVFLVCAAAVEVVEVVVVVVVAAAAHYSETDGSQVICSCSEGEAGKMAIIH